MQKKYPHYQVIMSFILMAFGIVLITTSFFVPPTGYIDPTVLTAFGEILTFAGALIGIEAKYKSKPPEA